MCVTCLRPHYLIRLRMCTTSDSVSLCAQLSKNRLAFRGGEHIVKTFISALIESATRESYGIFKIHIATIKLLRAFNNYNTYLKSCFSPDVIESIKNSLSAYSSIAKYVTRSNFSTATFETLDKYGIYKRYRQILITKKIDPVAFIDELDTVGCIPLKVKHDCSICGTPTMTIDTLCCSQQMCFTCISAFFAVNESAPFVSLFHKCPFCRCEFDDKMLEFDIPLKSRYDMLRHNVHQTPYDKVVTMKESHYFCMCQTCHLCFPVEKVCALDIANLPKICPDCDVSSFVEKRCPSCGFGIAKDGGCNNVKCMCGKSMCWLWTKN